MPDNFPIDLDGEKVQLDGAWYRKDELGRKIKAMVDSGDFRLSRPSGALEALEAALANLRTLSVKVPADMVEAITAAAARAGKQPETFLREAITLAVRGGIPAAPLPLGAPSPIPLTARVVPAAAPEPAPAEDAAAPIALTPKKAAPAGPDAEKGWFDRR